MYFSIEVDEISAAHEYIEQDEISGDWRWPTGICITDLI